MTETFDWLKPSLLWQADGLDFRQKEFFQPQLLEFGSDNFMDEFFAAATTPRPTAFAQVVAQPPTVGAPLKLFQPIHGRFYLVCGSLCCRQPGFPDRQIRRADGETVFFVIRKAINGVEYAWLSSGTTKGWKALAGQTRQVLNDEERHPLLTTTAGNCRTLFFGYLPVASRETYAVQPTDLAIGEEITDIRLQELGSRFAAPLTDLKVLDATPTEGDARLLSVYLLLDLWEYLATYLDDVATTLRDNPNATFSGEKATAKTALLTFFKNTPLQGSLTLAAALQTVAQKQATLNQTGGVAIAQLAAQGFGSSYNLKGVTIDMVQLQQKVQAALPSEKPPIHLPKIDGQSDTRYLLRCVYERPQCEPKVQVVSQASAPFTLAAFFDPEAPVRTVRIPLPGDVSVAGLRKLKKGVTFMLSDALRKKMLSIVGNEKKLLTEESLTLDSSSGDFAFICSFSIQIIFIVAFFLLLMFVVVLNFVFWWIAFFKICLPIPKRLLPG